MRNALKVVIFLCALISVATINQASVSALSSKDLALTEDPLFSRARQQERQKKLAEEQTEETKVDDSESADEVIDDTSFAPQSVTHTVLPGQSLSSIADHYQTTWRRLFDKNTTIENPDVLSVGAVVTIPTAEEPLEPRSLPEPTPAVQTTAATNRPATATRGQSARAATGSSAGNTYAAGYCTWYAKNRRPDLPNRMGNASSWVASAAAQGFATGTTPRAGAIGQQGNHVVYVEAVNGDGSVTVSEMNYKGLFVISSRTVAASAFRYIY